MTRAEIFNAITAERARQDDKHPVAFNTLVDRKDPSRKVFKICADDIKKRNERDESENRHTAYRLLFEEMWEFFAETDKARQVEEAIQNAALWVRIIEEITK